MILESELARTNVRGTVYLDLVWLSISLWRHGLNATERFDDIADYERALILPPFLYNYDRFDATI